MLRGVNIIDCIQRLIALVIRPCHCPARELVPAHHTIDGVTYTFRDLKDLLAKATPARAGDELAGIAARSSVGRVAAQMALADLPLTAFLKEAVVPYETDGATRLIFHSHDLSAFSPVASLTGVRVGD